MNRLLVMSCLSVGTLLAGEPLAWPEITRECKPWAYNWWPASAADPQSISNEFRRYAEGGLGGVHIIPIYGVKGAESRAVDYLSPKWMALFECAVATAESLGLGVDLTTGSGWCFGGPQVTRERGGWRFDKSRVQIAHNAFDLEPGPSPGANRISSPAANASG